MKANDKLVTTVRVVSKTEFYRVNEHTPKAIGEWFHAIAMVDVYTGREYRNFTRIGSAFDAVSSVGETMGIQATIKEVDRVHDGQTYTAITYVRKGVPAPAKPKKKSHLDKLLGR